MLPEVPVLTLDGPSGSGKGTIAQALAGRLGWHYLESGALYRVLGLLAGRNGIPLDDVEGLVALTHGLELTFENGRIILGKEKIDDEIRTEQSGDRASRIAPLPAVRSALLQWQRQCARLPGLVADGRDMGTVVFPGAACKIFLTASVEERAKRRFNQLRGKGFDVNIRRLFREIKERDQRDSTRSVSPLKPATDAFELDTTELSIDDVVAVVCERVTKAYNLS
jgi:cytidylate kinase